MNQLLLTTAVARHSATIQPDHLSFVKRGLPGLHWFDPSHQAILPSKMPDKLARWQRALFRARRWDRIAGSCGIHPPGLRELLCPPAASLGVREGACKQLDKQHAIAMKDLSLVILRGSKNLFEHWWGRPASSVPPKRLRAPRGATHWPGVRRTWMLSQGLQSLTPSQSEPASVPDARRRRSDGRRPVVLNMRRFVRPAAAAKIPTIASAQILSNFTPSHLSSP
jgi:hypothetical protein